MKNARGALRRSKMKNVRGVLRRQPHKPKRRTSFESLSSKAYELASLPIPEYRDGDDDGSGEEEDDFEENLDLELDDGEIDPDDEFSETEENYSYSRKASGELAIKTANILTSYEDYLKEIESEKIPGCGVMEIGDTEGATKKGSMMREWTYNEYWEKQRRYADNNLANLYADADDDSHHDNHNLASIQEPFRGYNYDEDRRRLHRHQIMSCYGYRRWMVVSTCVISLLAIILSLLQRNKHPQSQEVDEAVSSNQQQVSTKLTNTIHPVWYDRSMGWEGETYGDGLAFCKSISASRTVCPYEVYCPEGSGHNPFQGVRGEFAELFAPLWEQLWVGVGSSNKCTQVRDLSDTEKLQVGFIMCCIGDGGDKISDGWKNTPTGTSKAPTQQPNSTDAPKLTEKEQMALEYFKPSWFGRKDGYKGTTHMEAVEFCKSMDGMQLCMAEAVCPNGGFIPRRNTKPLFLRKHPFPREQWVPIATNANSWLLVGSINGDPKTTCQTYEDLHDNAQPLFGFDGSHTELKKHVVCCSVPDSEETQPG